MDSAPEVTNLPSGPAISVRAQVPLSELTSFFASAFAELAACGRDNISGRPFARYHSFDPGQIDVEAVMPLRAPVPVSGRVQPITLAGGPAVQIRHVGTYAGLGETYRTIEQWIQEHHRSRADAIREVYMTEPSVPPTDHVTIVVQPLQPRA